MRVVVENASFLCRSLYLPYEVPHWLYISIRNLHGFARFHGDSTALVDLSKRHGFSLSDSYHIQIFDQ